MDIECLKTKRHFADIESLEQCKKEHDGCVGCPFAELNTDIEQTNRVPLNKQPKQPLPEVLWPMTPLIPQKTISPREKGLFGKLFSSNKPEPQKPTRSCPRCGGTRFEYQGDKKDWVGITAKYRCVKCGKQFD